MQTRESAYNGQLARRLRDICNESARHKRLRKLAWWLCVMTLMGLSLSLLGCNHNPPLPCEPLGSPLKPALSQPMPSVSYQLSAANDIRRWQEMLKATSQTSKP